MKRWSIMIAMALAVAGLSFASLRLISGGPEGPGSAEAPLTGAQPQPARSSAALVELPTDASERAGPAATSGGGDVAPPLPQVSERKLVRNAWLELAVEDVLRSVQEVENIAGGAGGFVASSSVFTEEPPPPPLEKGEAQVQQEESPKRTQTAIIAIRVPSSEYQPVLSRLRGIAKEVRGESSSTSDATEEFADLEARRRNLEATEATYLKLLAQATTIQDILLLQDRINAVRLEIERIQGRINLLNDLSDLATIEVQLRPFLPAEGPEPPQGWAAAAADNAWETSQAVLRALGSGAIVGSVVLAWLAVPALAGLLAWRLFGPRRAGRGEA